MHRATTYAPAHSALCVQVKWWVWYDNENDLADAALVVGRRSDAAAVLLILLLGTTNGHLASVASMHMPSLLPLEQR